MILLLFGLVGGGVGLVVRYYLSHFILWLEEDVHQAYQYMFHGNVPSFQQSVSRFSPLICEHIFIFCFGFSTLFIGCYILLPSPDEALLIASYITILICISIIDWVYQLISVQLCLLLTVLGMAAAYWEISPLTLSQSIHSGLIGFGSFYIVYHLAKWGYQKEALGRGDYWLMLGLSSMLHWSLLPLFVLFACLCAISYAVWLKFNHKMCLSLPFAPFLCIAALLVILLNWYAGSMMILV